MSGLNTDILRAARGEERKPAESRDDSPVTDDEEPRGQARQQFGPAQSRPAGGPAIGGNGGAGRGAPANASQASSSGNAGGGMARAGLGSRGGIERADPSASVMKGRGPVGHDPRKYRYDVVRGRGANLMFTATTNDVMSIEKASDVLHKLHVTFGVDGETEDVLHAFDSGLFFCHTLNSGSVLVPGRSGWSVTGKTEEFKYDQVRDMLGVDMRRFFRAYADDVIEANKKVIDNFDPYDPLKAERFGHLMRVAAGKKLHRYPELAADSADAALKIDVNQRAALAVSKRDVLSNVFNGPDRLNANSRTVTAEGYDSTVGVNER